MKLVCISAMWCPACLIMRPRMNKVLQNFPNIEQIEYDYDMDEDIVSTYQVGTTLPVFILMDKDQELTRIVGEKKEEELLTIMKGWVE